MREEENVGREGRRPINGENLCSKYLMSEVIVPSEKSSGGFA